MSDLLMFTDTHGVEEPERAIVPFIAAATAAVSGQRAVVVCTAEAVRIGTPGYAGTVEADGLPTLLDLVDQLTSAGGQLWLCSACTTRRGITADDCIEGATIVGAARLVEALATEGRAISLT